jgi:hypothetical protein
LALFLGRVLRALGFGVLVGASIGRLSVALARTVLAVGVGTVMRWTLGALAVTTF